LYCCSSLLHIRRLQHCNRSPSRVKKKCLAGLNCLLITLADIPAEAVCYFGD
jgi:hypothetical protein